MSVCLSVHLSVCRVSRPTCNSRMEMLYAGLQETQNWQDGSPSHGYPWNLFRGQKVKVTRPINAVTDNALANIPRE